MPTLMLNGRYDFDDAFRDVATPAVRPAGISARAQTAHGTRDRSRNGGRRCGPRDSPLARPLSWTGRPVLTRVDSRSGRDRRSLDRRARHQGCGAGAAQAEDTSSPWPGKAKSRYHSRRAPRRTWRGVSKGLVGSAGLRGVPKFGFGTPKLDLGSRVVADGIAVVEQVEDVARRAAAGASAPKLERVVQVQVQHHLGRGLVGTRPPSRTRRHAASPGISPGAAVVGLAARAVSGGPSPP